MEEVMPFKHYTTCKTQNSPRSLFFSRSLFLSLFHLHTLSLPAELRGEHRSIKHFCLQFKGRWLRGLVIQKTGGTRSLCPSPNQPANWIMLNHEEHSNYGQILTSFLSMEQSVWLHHSAFCNRLASLSSLKWHTWPLGSVCPHSSLSCSHIEHRAPRNRTLTTVDWKNKWSSLHMLNEASVLQKHQHAEDGSSPSGIPPFFSCQVSLAFMLVCAALNF